MLHKAPPYEQWDDWVDLDPEAWPRKVERHHLLIPTLCFNCEAGCGLLAHVDKETLEIRRIEGNPLHPGSRGRTCAKGPATLSQIRDPERILEPLERSGPRGSGQWRPISWDAALERIGGRIRRALQEDRHNEILYHVGRPGEDGFMNRVLTAWGIDGHNSHTNVCSSSTRIGFYSVWGSDRGSADYRNAEFILLISGKLESGHYFNPHAQRIIDAKQDGAEIAVVDIRASNTASLADHWLCTRPGSEATMLLAMAAIILKEDLYDREFLERWTNWQATAPHLGANLDSDCSFEQFLGALTAYYGEHYPISRAVDETGLSSEQIETIARKMGAAGSRLCTDIWRSAASGNLGGWQIARSLLFLNVLTGSIGTEGGVSPNSWHKMKPPTPFNPPPHQQWNDLLWPEEYPLCHYEMSILLPHFLLEGRGRLDVYFTRVFNPVWTFPDGSAWIEALSDEERVGLHVALTPTWNETAQFADLILPCGHSPERHDHQSQETHMGRWIGLRQPVLREAQRRLGNEQSDTRETNPGKVWEEAELFLRLSWEIDPDGDLGIRKWFESPSEPGQPMTVDDYFQAAFENVPGLSEAAAEAGESELEFMRRRGAFEVEPDGERLDLHRRPVEEGGVEVDGERLAGFPTPSGKLEIYSQTLAEWGWPEQALPDAIASHVSDPADDEMVLIPTFRLPVHIHSRSGNAKWLLEIAHANPLWLHPEDAARLGIEERQLVRISTGLGYFVTRAWPTGGIRPGLVACSHHLGRWRKKGHPGSRWNAPEVSFEQQGSKLLVRRLEAAHAFESSDPDSKHLWWKEVGVHQNMTFPVQPDPVSGMHCWHQIVNVEPAQPEDREGDVMVDREKSMERYREWLQKARGRPEGTKVKRPLWYKRPLRPVEEAFRLEPEG